MTPDPDDAGGSETSTDWDGYSDYKTVSKSIVDATQNAINAYAELESRHAEGAKVQQRMAARARMHIKAAALQLLPELQRNSESNEQYQKILARWTGETDSSDDGESKPKLPASDGGTIEPERETREGDAPSFEYSPPGSDSDDTDGVPRPAFRSDPPRGVSHRGSSSSSSTSSAPASNWGICRLVAP